MKIKKQEQEQGQVKEESGSGQPQGGYSPVTGYEIVDGKYVFPGKGVARISEGFQESPPAPTTGNKVLDRLMVALKEATARKEAVESELQRYGDQIVNSVCAGGALARTGEYVRIMNSLSEADFALSQIQAAVDRMKDEQAA